jgi:hypothetical protein
MNEPRVYQNSAVVLVVIVAMGLIILGVLIFGLGFQNIAFTIPIWVVGFLFILLIFMTVSSKVILSEDEISTKGVFGTKTLRWTEIARVSGSGYNIKLYNHDGDVTLTPSSRLPKYEEIIDFIGLKRPDLFSPQDYSEMKRGWSSILQVVFVLFIFGGVLLGFGFSFMDSPDTSISNLAPALIFVVILLVYVLMMLFAPRALILDGNTLAVKYLFNEKVLRADEIAFIQLGFTQTRNGRQYYVAVHLKGKGNIRFTGLSVGLPIAYLVLKNWHKNSTQGQFSNQPRPSLDNIAPNWSDNSRN